VSGRRDEAEEVVECGDPKDLAVGHPQVPGYILYSLVRKIAQLLLGPLQNGDEEAPFPGKGGQDLVYPFRKRCFLAYHTNR